MTVALRPVPSVKMRAMTDSPRPAPHATSAPDASDSANSEQTTTSSLVQGEAAATSDQLVQQVLEQVLPEDLRELERRVLRAVMRGGVSMEEIAELRPSTVVSPEAAIRALEDGNARFFSGESRRS